MNAPNEVATTRPTVHSIIEKLPLSNTHYLVVFLAGLGFMFDSFDVFVVSYAMPSVTKEWNLTPVVLGTLATAGMWGMLVGVLFWGPLCDRFGRKFGFAGTVLGFSLLTGLTALSQDAFQFGAFRFLTGLFLGGMVPINTACTAEYVSASHRGRFVSVLTCFWPLGMLMAAGCSMWLVADYGWRVLFYIGAIPILLGLAVIMLMPESPRWLAIRGRTEEAGDVLRKLGANEEDVRNLQSEKAVRKLPLTTLLKPPYLKRFIFTSGYFFFGHFGYYGILLWLPTLLVTVHQLSLAKTFSYTFMVAIAVLLGRLTAFYTIDAFGRKQLFYVGFGLGGVACLLFGLIENPDYLVWGACILMYIIEQGGAGIIVWTPELYPSEIRATANGWSSAAGRLASGISPIVVGYFLGNQWIYGVFVLFAIVFWIVCALVYFMGIETKGKTLDDIGAA
jgi:putative MFS transporter